MGIISNVISKLEGNREKRLNGDMVAIPWSLPRLSKALPGIQQSSYVICTANSKVGKSQLTDYLYMYQPLEWWLKEGYKSKTKIKIFYFSLEMSKESKILAAISYRLFSEYNKIISPQKLQSLFADYTLDDETLELIKSDEFTQWLEDLESMVTIYDNIRNPYGIYNIVKTYMEANGSWTYKKIDWQNDDGSYEEKTVKDQYTPNDPDEYVIVITDHVSLLQAEKGQSLHEAMGNFSSNFCLQLRDKYKCCVVNVQQQAAASEQQQFTNRGETIVDKLKPTPDYLGDNKLTGRDCNLMIGLFYPARYGITDYDGWDLTRIGKNHRELLILLNRDGVGSASLPVYFNGASNFFAELPRDESEKNNAYDMIKQWNELSI